MTTILNTLELIPHNKVSYDFPNVRSDLERLYLDAVYALGGVEFSTDETDERTFNQAKASVESVLDDLKQYATGSEVEGLLDYAKDTERAFVERGEYVLNAMRRLNKFSKDILDIDNTWNREDIANGVAWIAEQLGEMFDGGSHIRYMMQNRGWRDMYLDYLVNLVGNPVVEVLAHYSSAHDLVYGVEGRILISGTTVTIMNGPNSLVLSPIPGDMRIVYTVPGKTERFLISVLSTFFIDICNPTLDEIQMYEISTGTTYDIIKWKEIFGGR
jgi:hypothetical protein